MKNYLQNGHIIRVTAPAGGIASGDAIIVGSIFGIAAYSSAEGDPVELSTTGVFQLPKASAAGGERGVVGLGNGVVSRGGVGDHQARGRASFKRRVRRDSAPSVDTGRQRSVDTVLTRRRNGKASLAGGS